MFQNELAAKQPIIHRVLKQALLNKRLAHAYLFVGSDPVVKEKTAILLAQSLVCPNKNDTGWACENCETCHRIAQFNYGDFIFLNGKDISIKKETILNLQHSFNQTALEVANQKIYIINYVENSTIEALNSLLKFLEDPISQTVTGILIAMDENLVIPTIVSRCQVLTFLPTNFEVFYQSNLKAGLNDLDAYLLSKLIKDSNQSLEIVESDPYLIAKAGAIQFLEKYLINPYEALFEVQLTLFKSKNKALDDQIVKYFFEILIIFFQDCILGQENGNKWWSDMIVKYQLRDVSKYLAIVLRQKRKLNPYNNLALLIDQFVYQIQEVNTDVRNV